MKRLVKENTIKKVSPETHKAIKQVALDTHANKVANVEKSRANLYHLRHTAADILGDRIAHCGHTPIKNTNLTISKREDGHHHYTGVQTCGSVWVCPVCSLKISKRRQIEVFQLMQVMLNRPGVSIGFLTLTMWHSNIQPLELLKDSVLGTWRKIEQSRKHKDLAKRYNHLGDIRALECKISRRTGWHPHLHIVIFAECSENELQVFANEIILLWVQKHKGKADKKAQKYKPIYSEQGISDYITKWDCSSELTLSNMKIDKQCRDNYTPFELLQGIANGNDADHWKSEKFKEYAKAMKRARQLTFSREIRKLHRQMTGAKTDEQIVKEEQGSTEVLKIDIKLWHGITFHRLQAHVLNVMEFKGLPELQMFLLEFGLFTTYHEKGNTLCLDNSLSIFRLRITEN